MTKLSIVLPTWNGARFLRPQLDSILAQTDGDFELIVVDDGSTDETVALIDDYARRDRRMRRLPSEGNKGQVHRLVELIGAASGEFVAISDQDDVWHPDRNARLLAAIGDRAVAFGQSRLIDAEGSSLGNTLLGALRLDASRQGALGSLFHPLLSAHAAIIRRKWLEVAAFYSSLPFDWIIGLEALYSNGMIYVDNAFVDHRLHGGNQMNGGVIKASGGLLSRHRLRTSTSFRGSDRLSLYLILLQLRRSQAIPTGVRRDIARACDACLYGWYYKLKFEANANRRVRKELHEALAPYASSQSDYDLFSRRVASMTNSYLSATNLSIALAKYRDRPF